MKGFKKIWVVEQGSYSDYRVLAVFEDEATARAWANAINADGGRYGEEAEVSEMDLVTKGTKPEKVTTYRVYATLWDDGTVEDADNLRSDSDFPITALYGVPPKRPRVRYVRAPCYNNRGGRLEVIGSSAQSVMKVVSDRIAMWKAGAWAGPEHKEIIE